MTPRLAALVALGVALHAEWLPAQAVRPGAPARQGTAPTTRVRPELRLDYLGAEHAQAIHAGAGVSIPVGTYARASVVAGAGPGWDGDEVSPSGRVDLIGRFLIDPFRRSRIGVSIGGGLSVRYDDDDLRGLALLLVDVEGPGARGWIPFAAAGLGGGMRLGAGVRRAASVGR